MFSLEFHFGKNCFFIILTLSNRVAIDRRIDTPIFFFFSFLPLPSRKCRITCCSERSTGHPESLKVHTLTEEKTLWCICFLHYIRSIVCIGPHPKQLGQNPACKWWIGQPSASTDQDQLTNISLSSCVFLFFLFSFGRCLCLVNLPTRDPAVHIHVVYYGTKDLDDAYHFLFKRQWLRSCLILSFT